ncbi:hypothetical protein AB2B38_002755 [Balneola sp. MJW-20]|uniref:F0F1 ATP synthase subunit B family protein n=1 Tax=Gracilimonas aurantiaca TaxID=3234185 RepID=UPI00346537CE
MNIDWFTFIAQILNFLILLYLLRRFLYKPLLSIMDDREEKIKLRMEEADREYQTAQEKVDKYDRMLRDFESNVDRMGKEAVKETEEFREDLYKKVRAEVGQSQKNWEQSLEDQKEVFLSELYRQTASGIVDLMGSLIKDLSHKELDDLVVGKFLEQIRSMKQHDGSMAFHAALESGEGQITVISSFQLDKSVQEKIIDSLKYILTEEINIQFKRSSILGYGIEMRANGWKIGWSTAGFMVNLKKRAEEVFENNVAHNYIADSRLKNLVND